MTRPTSSDHASGGSDNGSRLATSSDPIVVKAYETVKERLASDLAVAKETGRNLRMNWDHPLVRAMIANGLMDGPAAVSA